MANKTEKPTHKRLDDASKKGQILKSRDLTVSFILLSGIIYLTFFFDLHYLKMTLNDILQSGYNIYIWDYCKSIAYAWMLSILPFILCCAFFTVVVSLAQSKFRLATEAVKINFGALNPANGFKKIFSLRTVKEFVKTLLYLILFFISVYVFWGNHKSLFFNTLDSDVKSIFNDWGDLLLLLVLYCLGSLVIVIIIDMVMEYLLFMKDMKMDKQEVKREYKEQEGDPEIKYRRKELHRELLSEQLKSDIDNSRLVIANPTHIAIGIFFKPNLSPVPLISVRETNQVALAVRGYAEEKGIPVITDVKLARRLYATHRRYDYVCFDVLDAIIRLLIWLEDVEKAKTAEPENDGNLADSRDETGKDETQG